MTLTDLTITSIGDVQIALMENDNSAIKRYIERLDRETSNDAMRQAGTHFDFKTTEIEGVVRTSSGHLAEVFGYKSPNSLLELLKRWGIEGIKMGGFTHDTCIEIRKDLNLFDKDNKTILYDWPAFLIGGMNSANEPAHKVQLYLLKMEKMARIGVISSKQLPDPAHVSAMIKLSSKAWDGNLIASYVLETVYGVPVTSLIPKAKAESGDDKGNEEKDRKLF